MPWMMPLLALPLPLLLLLLLAAAGTPASAVAPLHPRVRILLDRLERARAQASEGSSGHECLVTDARFGAQCDSATDDTAALQAAIDGCAGTVALPEGRTCLSHTLALRNGTQLRIPDHAVLKAFPNPAMWNNRSLWLVHAGSSHDTGIYGGGTIDGSGNEWWKVAGGNRPHLFNNIAVHNYSIRDVTLMNSGRGILGFGAPCSDVMVDNVTVMEPAIGNSDGIDVSCDGFVIQNSLVQNGDDSICMKSTAAGSAKNGLIRNCTVRNGVQQLPATENYPGLAGGLVLGTAIAPAMENITFSNNTVEGALAGIRIKFRPSQMGSVKNIIFEDIRIVDPVVYAIDIIMSSDHVSSGQLENQQPQTVDLQGVTIRNVEGVLGPVPLGVCGKGRICPRAVARFSCTPTFPCHGMRLEHVHVEGFRPYNISDKGRKVEVEACTFANFSASSWLDVSPAGCIPPSLKTGPLKSDDLVSGLAQGKHGVKDDVWSGCLSNNYTEPFGIFTIKGVRQCTWGATCSAMIDSATNRYHLYFSWFKTATNGTCEAGNGNWRNESVIIAHAVSDFPDRGYEIIVEDTMMGRPGMFDATTLHNPTVLQLRDKSYAVYYMGLNCEHIPDPEKCILYSWIGVAHAETLDGPWERLDEPVLSPTNQTWELTGLANPGVVLMDDGSLLMTYRGIDDIGIGMASAPSWDSQFSRLNNGEAVLGTCISTPSSSNHLEDLNMLRTANGLEMFVHQEGAGVVCGAHAFSTNEGLNWTFAGDLYNVSTSGSTFIRRERPQVLVVNGLATHVFTGVTDPDGFPHTICTEISRPSLKTDEAGVARFEVDLAASKQRPWSHFYSEGVSAGHIGLASRADYRQHLAMAAEKCGFKYVRGHGLLDDDVAISFAPGLNSWLINLFGLVDFQLSIGVLPFLEVANCI